jgi:poly-gamma-glutamate synthesis protein (capsule biosynthesis protein)
MAWRSQKLPGDVALVSLHWGGNWGYLVPEAQRRFAHRLIDAGGADIVHGHSSHHFKGIEVYKGRLVVYGCGDFVTDYEGIAGHEAYRPDLVLGYFVAVDRHSGELQGLDMVPFRSRRFRLERVRRDDAEWAQKTLAREGREFGTSALLHPSDELTLRWPA